jgi:hypothetical protein
MNNLKNSCDYTCGSCNDYPLHYTESDFRAFGLSEEQDIKQMYKILRAVHLPNLTKAKGIWNLCKAFQEHGIFSISWFCRLLLQRARPKFIHNFSKFKSIKNESNNEL